MHSHKHLFIIVFLSLSTSIFATEDSGENLIKTGFEYPVHEDISKIPVNDFAKDAEFRTIKISPDGILPQNFA